MSSHHSYDIESARRDFRQLIAGNPNYFGNLPRSEWPPVFKITANTRYERLLAAGFNPDLGLLEAVVQINALNSHGGDSVAGGGREFVRFFMDYGSGWQDAGLASFVAGDIGGSFGGEAGGACPLNYALSLEHHLNRNRYSSLNPPRVRAILSWEAIPPDDAEWQPVWGNTIDRHVQITPRPRKLIELASDKFAQAKAVFPESMITELPARQPKSIETLAKRYTLGDGEFQVEPHRFAMPDVEASLVTSFFGGSALAEAKSLQYQAIGLEWQAIVSALEDTRGDTRYEQLQAVGFDPNREWLVANFSVKRPMGYQGGVPELGSVEHVAFWVDWRNSGDWTYLSTVGVAVHDLSAVPVDGLNYWVGVPVRLREQRISGERSMIGRVRAVLSWQARPSASDPKAVPRWGNCLDACFEIKAGRVFSEQPVIDAIGGIDVEHINVGGDGMTVPHATFTQTGAPADPWLPSRSCAFGGDIYIHAEVPVRFSLAAYKYRLMVRRAGAKGGGDPLMSPFIVTRSLALGAGTVLVSPELGSGWVNYLHPDQNLYSVLGCWQSAELAASERNECWEIKLEWANSVSASALGATGWHRLQLDNQTPVAAITIDRERAIVDCNEYKRGCLVGGYFVAYDPNDHFGAWELDREPEIDDLQKPEPAQPLAPSSPTGFTPGNRWQLSAACNASEQPLPPCDHVATVRAWANTVVHSSQFCRHYAEANAPFCLRSQAEAAEER